MMKLEGSAYFRQRLICSTLSGKSVLIKNIRSNSENPGLQDYEASLLRLLDKITNGCVIQIDETGTTLCYKPGILVGGKHNHDCGKTRSIGYFLEAIVVLAPFCKKPLSITLTGITNHTDNLDISVDLFRTVTIPNLTCFGIHNIEFKIKSRGAAPSGGGMVYFSCPIINRLSQIQLVDRGQVKRVRGIAYTSKMNPIIANRMKDTAKSELLNYLSDVFIYTDHYKGKESGQSPGYGLSLVAETTTGCLISTEQMGMSQSLPEELASTCTTDFLHEILQGGCVDTANQSILLLLMVLGPEDVSKIRIGKLSPYTIAYLQHIKEFFNVSFSIVPDPETKTILLS
jgi:RNA 3'-terminal phosphate cyclase-like protein